MVVAFVGGQAPGRAVDSTGGEVAALGKQEIWMVLLRYFAEQVIYATLVTKGVAIFGAAVLFYNFPINGEPYAALGCAAVGALYIL